MGKIEFQERDGSVFLVGKWPDELSVTREVLSDMSGATMKPGDTEHSVRISVANGEAVYVVDAAPEHGGYFRLKKLRAWRAVPAMGGSSA